MTTLGRLTTVFDAETSKFKAGTVEVQRGIAGIERSVASLSNSSRGFAAGLLPGLASISEIIQGIPQIGRLAGGLIRPLTDAAEEGIRLNMVLETAKIGFEGVAGSAEKSQKHIAALMAFGKASPFRFEGLLEASRFMTAFGFSLDEQIPKLTVWGNALAASGQLSAEKIQDVVRAFGQMRTAGRVNAQDMNQLTNANIPGWELLAKAIGKTVEQTRKLAEAGKLEGKAAVEAITAMMTTEPRFKDMMKRMEATGAGRLSAAQDIIQFAQAKATESLTQDISTTLGAALQKENVVGQLAGTINSAIAPVSSLIKTAAIGLLGGGLTSGFIEGIQAGKDAVKQAVGDFALDGIIGTAKSWLGIQSPSKVFYEMGLLSAQGFALGLKDGFQDNPLVKELEAMLADPRVQALLDVIGRGEGTFDPKSGKRIYNKIFGGKRVGLGEGHPGIYVPFRDPKTGKTTSSSAAGYGQFLERTWKGASSVLGGLDFSNPHDQELAMVYLMRQRGMLGPLMSGDTGTAIRKGGKEWASLPGSPYGQPTQSMSGALSLFQSRLSSYVNGAPVSATNPMPVSVVMWPMMGGSIPGQSRQGKRPRQYDVDVSFDESSIQIADPFQRLMARSSPLTTDSSIASTTRLLPKALQDTKELSAVTAQAANGMQQLLRGAGEWGKLVIRQSATLKEQLEALNETIPDLRENLTRTLADLPQGIGNIFGDAVRQWDGTFKGFLMSLAQGVQQTLADIAAQMVNSSITKLLINLGLSALGGAVGGIAVGGGSGSSGGLGSAFAGGFAEGGFVPPGQWGWAGEKGPEPIYGGQTGITVVPNGAIPKVGGQQVVNNYYNTIQLPSMPKGSYNSPKSARQHAEMIMAYMQGSQT